MSLLERFARGLLPPVPELDLLAESGQRAVLAAVAARDELGPGVPVAAPELPATRRLPDPYGPDPVVFGSVPRVRSPFRD